MLTGTILALSEGPLAQKCQFVSDCTKMWHYHSNNTGSPQSLIRFRNHIDLCTDKEVQFLRKDHLSIDASNPYFVLDKRPRVICLSKAYLKRMSLFLSGPLKNSVRIPLN